MNIPLNTNNLIISFSVGLGLFCTTYFMFILKTIKNEKFSLYFSKTKESLNKNRKFKSTERIIKKAFEVLLNLTKREKYLILASALFVLGMSKSTRAIPISITIGSIIGLITVRFISNIKKSILKTKKLREVVVLFEGIEMYSKAGYSLVQSIRASKMLTDTITPYIDKCLSYWSMGPQKALEILKDELNLEETESLILLMMHLESAGVNNLQGMLQREAHNIDRLQKMKVELKIAHRPLILVVYKILPIAAILGIVIGSLLYRMFYTLTGIGVLGS